MSQQSRYHVIVTNENIRVEHSYDRTTGATHAEIQRGGETIVNATLNHVRARLPSDGHRRIAGRIINDQNTLEGCAERLAAQLHRQIEGAVECDNYTIHVLVPGPL
jgi:hypothetical protein